MVVNALGTIRLKNKIKTKKQSFAGGWRPGGRETVGYWLAARHHNILTHSFSCTVGQPQHSPVALRLDMANCVDFLLGCCALWRVVQRRYDGRNVNLRMSKPDVGSEQVHPDTAAAAAIGLLYSSKSNSLLVSRGVWSNWVQSEFLTTADEIEKFYLHFFSGEKKNILKILDLRF